MFVCMIKAKKLVLGAGCFALALLCTAGAFRYAADRKQLGEARETATQQVGYSLDGKTAEKRLQFLESVGLQVEPEPLEVVEVKVPSAFDDTYTAYNELQKQAGFDLKKYAGKTLKRYRYQKTAEKGTPAEYVHLLLYKNTIVGGDVTPAEAGSASAPLVQK